MSPKGGLHTARPQVGIFGGCWILFLSSIDIERGYNPRHTEQNHGIRILLGFDDMLFCGY